MIIDCFFWLIFLMRCEFVCFYYKIKQNPTNLVRLVLQSQSVEGRSLVRQKSIFFVLFWEFFECFGTTWKSVVVRWCQKCDEMHDLAKVPRQDGTKTENLRKSVVVRWGQCGVWAPSRAIPLGQPLVGGTLTLWTWRVSSELIQCVIYRNVLSEFQKACIPFQ